MKKIVVLGGSGMLGSMVVRYLINAGYDVRFSIRDPKFEDMSSFMFDPLDNSSWDNIPTDADYYLNCIGTIKPYMDKDIKKSIYVNAYFPHLLAEKFKNVIHITTDCVFSGATGNYNENDIHDALDNYGKSKSLGEPSNCMVLRTSIIGPELHGFVSLVEWVRQQQSKEINGFTNHMWNGITTLQYAKVCDDIISMSLYEEGVYHVVSPNRVSKFDLVSMISDHYKVGAIIQPVEASVEIDRTMSTVKALCGELNIPEIKNQIYSL